VLFFLDKIGYFALLLQTEAGHSARVIYRRFPMFEDQDQIPVVTASLVAESDRLSFLPNSFGERFMLQGEGLVFAWMSKLSEDYCGAYWHFYTLSNGGFYMAPAIDEPMRVSVNGNGFEGELSADGAGIVATLFALCQLANQTEDDRLIEAYHHLRDYLDNHAEGSLIFRAID
jgi:hypothetical protein